MVCSDQGVLCEMLNSLLGSGTVTILEAYRALIAANFTPVHDVEFHWYSAEVSCPIDAGALRYSS